eukprot:CAMPEP_0177532712 /NCGR_PEP_ID=MMETSP0369-20130122/54843_1 /TAXON_ID=447022 ORGANISM="Scrippsiella hangoei-like, Strain SHHI-4" /NCGR_SAMPLE_ID=MMETSP0369 /ASSEMBLY_ACC=CAM_ASM_000364 /LENGTH=65 /DNA_ID=CAMNT_0019014181 /DNA_START=1 /DNA_END=196 /DNA_ORIENTATION=-
MKGALPPYHPITEVVPQDNSPDTDRGHTPKTAQGPEQAPPLADPADSGLCALGLGRRSRLKDPDK